jgi:hypothetical protein
MSDSPFVQANCLKNNHKMVAVSRRSSRMLKKRIHMSEHDARRAQAGDRRIFIQPAALPLYGVPQNSRKDRWISGNFSRNHETVGMKERSKRSERHHGLGERSSVRNCDEKLSLPGKGKPILVPGSPCETDHGFNKCLEIK